MADGLERELSRLDGDRPLPPTLYSRLESALLDDAEARRIGYGELAVALDALDGPRPVPAPARAALERALIPPDRRAFRSRLILGAAAAIIVLVGAVAALGGRSSRSHHQVAVGPAPTVPPVSASAQGQEQGQAAAAAGAAAQPAPTATNAPRGSSSAARGTTPTTWDCGLCARNGYSGSATPPTSPPSTATFQPSAGPPAQAAALAAQTGIGKIDPSSGPHQGGTVVTLTGSGFTGANGVRFGAGSALNFTVVSDSEIRVQTPPSPTPQRATVAVTYADGSSTPTSGDGPFFTYT